MKHLLSLLKRLQRLQRKNCNIQGFTMFEILIVFFIIVLLAGFSIAGYNWFNQYRVLEKATELVSDLEMAKSLAFERGETKVCFTPNSYEIRNDLYALRKNMPQGISLSSSFSGPCHSSNCIIVKRNKLFICSGNIIVSGFNRCYKIVINNITGRVSLRKCS